MVSFFSCNDCITLCVHDRDEGTGFGNWVQHFIQKKLDEACNRECGSGNEHMHRRACYDLAHFALRQIFHVQERSKARESLSQEQGTSEGQRSSYPIYAFEMATLLYKIGISLSTRGRISRVGAGIYTYHRSHGHYQRAFSLCSWSTPPAWPLICCQHSFLLVITPCSAETDGSLTISCIQRKQTSHILLCTHLTPGSKPVRVSSVLFSIQMKNMHISIKTKAFRVLRT